MRIWLLLVVALVGCDVYPYTVAGSSYRYRTGEPDWTALQSRLTAPRAAHAAIAVGGNAFLVIGGDTSGTGVLSTNQPLELSLDIERCVADEPVCIVVGQLARGGEQPDVARAPDGSIVIADDLGLQIFDPATGQTDAIDAAPSRLIESAAGVVALGLPGVQNPTYGVIRSRATGFQTIAAPPATARIESAAALDHDHIVIVSKIGSASLDVATGTWSAVPAVPTAGYEEHAVQVGDGAVLVVVDGEASAYLLSAASGQWRPIPVPSTRGYVHHAIAVAGGAVVITEYVNDQGDGATTTFRLSDQTWIAGPGAPPWERLNATTVLDDGQVISVGGSDDDFIGARSS